MVHLDRTVIIICLLLFILMADREEMHFSIYTTVSMLLLLFLPICIAGWKLTKAHTKMQFHAISNIIKLVFAGSIIVIIFHSFT